MTDQTVTHPPVYGGNEGGETINLKLASPAFVSPSGDFEIVAITAGEANGWNFSADCLQASVPLWDRVTSLIDHTDLWEGPSVTKLAGVLYDPQWDNIRRAVSVKFSPYGPLASLARQLGKDYLEARNAGRPVPNIGFSADISFTANKKDVIAITRVRSCDLVLDPARGGEFLRVLNQARGSAPTTSKEHTMSEPVTTTPAANQPDPSQPVAPWHPSELEAARSILSSRLTDQERAAEEAKQQQEFRRQMCALLLEQGVSASRLPQPAQDFIRARFTEPSPLAGGQGGERITRIFNPSDLTSAIEEVRALSGSLATRGIVGASGIVSGMFTAEEQLQAAVDDLLGAPRDEKLKSLNVHRLTGIRELYLMLTGDDDMRGAYVPQRVRLQHTTATFTGLVKNALNKVLVNRWEALGRAGYDWWQKIATLEHFTSLNQVTWIIFGTVGSMPSITEGAEYTELQIGDSPETSSFTKYGGYVGITLEALDRDDTRKLAAVPRELANAGIRNISSLVAALFSSTAGAGPLMADGGRLFNATAVTTLTGHLNLLTTALSAAQWETVSQAMFNQPMLIKNAASYYGTGAKMAINPKYCLVPRALELTARQIFEQPWVQTVQVHAETTQMGKAEVVVVPDWTDLTDWAAVADPTLVPGVMIGERFGIMPEIFVAGDETSPAVFMNDESRIKVRHFLAVGVADFRPLTNNHV